MKKVILASKSPRRKDLLEMAGISFEIRTKEVSEDHPAGVRAEDIPLFLAQKKANAIKLELNADEVVIGADTVVILNGKIYEKPTDEADAIRMLSELSGQTHTVITGVCLISKEKEISFSDRTEVTFHLLTEEEITSYVRKYKPFDKAGSYACQEWIGAIGIARFNGDYFNVVGLPVSRVYAALKEM
ncbi:MAG: Maf family protein [Chitinophagales bacterium]